MQKNKNNAATRAALLPFLAALFALHDSAQAAEPWFPVRTHNPFLQIFGMPGFSGGELTPVGASTLDFSFDLANHAESGTLGSEEIVIDGESYTFNVAWRKRVGNTLEIGVDIPLVAHADGVLDELIEGWHDLWGMSNAKRTGPPNILRFRFQNPAIAPVDLDSGAAGPGDIRLSAAIPLGGQDSRQRVSLRTSVKLPTGDADELLGSGAVDYSAGIYADFAEAFGLVPMNISLHGGVLAPGDSDLFSGIQESAVPFGGLAADWRFGQRWRAMALLYYQGAFLESELEEIGGSTLQLVLGGTYRFGVGGPLLSIGVVEDVVSDATVDFALQMSLRYVPGGRASRR